ncbi:MAG: response regulator [Thermoanaerobaculia bacterium]
MSEQPFNILVVDDSAIILEAFAAFLENDGFHPIVAESGAEGLSYVASLRPPTTVALSRGPAAGV